MSGERNLDRLIAGMTPVLDPVPYVFVTCASATVPAGVDPLMQFEEDEGTTLILSQADAAGHGLASTYPCRRITLHIHSSLEAIGFLAAITRRLAEAGLSVNPVSAYYHDHIFVAEDQAETAMATLRDMASRQVKAPADR